MREIRPVVIKAVVPPELAGERIDKAVAQLSAGQLSRGQARNILLRGGVWIGDQRVRKQSFAVEPGMALIVVHPPAFEYPELSLTAADVLWEDPHLIALRKQAGWFVQPTAWNLRGNIEHALGEFLTARDGRPPRIHLTHRLDRETSGVLVVSKDPSINAAMQRVWSSGAVEKLYRCLVAGSPPPVWESHEPLGPGAGARHRVDLQNGRAAHTEFSTLSQTSDYAELQAHPKTGRTHQIRIHAAHAGFPLLGDARYDGPMMAAGMPVPRVMLHAFSLQFPHPKTSKLIELRDEPPADYAAVREHLGLP